MTMRCCWCRRTAVLVAWTAACLAAPLPAAAQAQDPKPPPAVAKPGDGKQTPARRAREAPRKDGEERPRPDVAVSFPTDI